MAKDVLWHSTRWTWAGGQSRRALIRHTAYRATVTFHKRVSGAIDWVMLLSGYGSAESGVKVVVVRTARLAARRLAENRALYLSGQLAKRQGGKSLAKYVWKPARIMRETKHHVYYEVPIIVVTRERWLS